jgi:hypothetical protein
VIKSPQRKRGVEFAFLGLPEETQEKNGVIAAIDADNLLISSREAGQKLEGYDLRTGFEKMFEWIRTFGKILAVHLYLPSSQSINDDLWNDLWEKYHAQFKFFETVYCPKTRDERGKRIDNVDRHLIEHTTKLISLFPGQVKYFCLASGDLDYSSLLWELKRKQKIEIAFALGSEKSFSDAYRQMKIAAKHPATGADLIHYFSPHKTMA